MLPTALPKFVTSAGVAVGAALENTAQAIVVRREMMRREGIVVEGMWVINERGLTKVRSNEEAEGAKYDDCRWGFQLGRPRTYTSKTRDDRFSNESTISRKIART